MDKVKTIKPQLRLQQLAERISEYPAPAFRGMETGIPPVGNHYHFTFEFQFFALLETCKGYFAPLLRQGLDKFLYEHLTVPTKCNVTCVHGIEVQGFFFTGTPVS